MLTLWFVRAKQNSVKVLGYLCAILQDMDKETDSRTAGAIALLIQPFLTLISHLREMHNYAWWLNTEFKLPLIKHSNQIPISKKFRSPWPFYEAR